jgi:hypothetical protein
MGSGTTGENRKPVATPKIDIDAIVDTARKGRR